MNSIPCAEPPKVFSTSHSLTDLLQRHLNVTTNGGLTFLQYNWITRGKLFNLDHNLLSKSFCPRHMRDQAFGTSIRYHQLSPTNPHSIGRCFTRSDHLGRCNGRTAIWTLQMLYKRFQTKPCCWPQSKSQRGSVDAPSQISGLLPHATISFLNWMKLCARFW